MVERVQPLDLIAFQEGVMISFQFARDVMGAPAINGAREAEIVEIGRQTECGGQSGRCLAPPDDPAARRRKSRAQARLVEAWKHSARACR